MSSCTFAHRARTGSIGQLRPLHQNQMPSYSSTANSSPSVPLAAPPSTPRPWPRGGKKGFPGLPSLSTLPSRDRAGVWGMCIKGIGPPGTTLVVAMGALGGAAVGFYYQVHPLLPHTSTGFLGGRQQHSSKQLLVVADGNCGNEAD